MPFHASGGYEFSESGIAAYARAVSGFYGVYNGKHWIYIDEAQDIRTRLYEHLRGESERDVSIMATYPEYFIFEACDPQLGQSRKAELVREHRPSCNLAGT